MSDYRDYPLQECADTALKYLDRGNATIFQKWTCQHCGSRQTMDQPNTFFRSGKCEECNSVTLIQACNYTLILSGKTR